MLVGQIFHTESMHFFHQAFIIDEVLMLFLDRVLHPLRVDPKSCAPLIPELFLNHIIFLLFRQSFVNERLEISLPVQSRQNGRPLLFISFRRDCRHGYHHGSGRQQRGEIHIDSTKLVEELLEGEKGGEFEDLHGKVENFNEVFDRLSAHLFLLFGEYIEKKCESLLSACFLADVQDELSEEHES